MLVRAEKHRDWTHAFRFVVVLFVACTASATLQSLAPKGTLVSHAETMLAQPAAVNDIVVDAGSGVIWGVLGGFRTIVADFLFLRGYIAWEDRKLTEYETLAELAVLVDPRPEIFWKFASTTIAFDMPVWRIEEGGGMENVPLSVQRRIRLEHMERAVAFLEKGAARFPENPMFPIEMGKIVLNASEDFDRTAELFLRAWRMDTAPPFIGRLISRVLESAGRPEEGLQILRRDLERIDPNHPEGFIPLIHQRISELEEIVGSD